MTKLDQAIEALRALPSERQDAAAEIVLEITQSLAPAGETTLTPEQLAEVRRRRANFTPGDPARLEKLLKSLL